jgi:RHS repeat-associated protein
VLDGDLAVDANGNLSVAWIDNHEAWEDGYLTPTNDWDLRLRTATLPADVTPRVAKHYYANGQRIATRVDGDLYYVLGDHLGSTSLVVDESGAEQGHVIYDAYGQVVENTLSEGLTDRLFTGQTWDDTIGLYFYNARYYDPLVGQFTQPDSLVADPLNPRAWNRFSYTYGNPVNYIDPTGNVPWLLLGGVFLLGAGAGGYYAHHQGYGFDTWQFYAYAGIGGLAGLIGAATGLWIESALVPAGALWWQAAGAGFVGGVASGMVEQMMLEAAGEAILGTEPSMARVLSAGLVSGVTGGIFAGGARIVASRRDIVYRNPNPAEHPIARKVGFSPKNPDANYSVAAHVASGSRLKTQSAHRHPRRWRPLLRAR